VGVDRGTACLRLFNDTASKECPSQIPVMELLAPRNAQETELKLSFGLGKFLHIRPEGNDVVISFDRSWTPGAFRVEGAIEGLSSQGPTSRG